jgi:hypothetical protein
MDIAGRHHRHLLRRAGRFLKSAGDSELAIRQALSCNVVHSKSLSLVERSVLTTSFLTAQTKGFRVFFAPQAGKAAAPTLVQGLVKPAQSEVSEFCRELTGLTAESVAEAGTFADVVAILKKEYHAKDRLWASWGDYDRRQFERECADKGVAYPFGRSHLNVKTLFAVATGLGREVGMDGAYQQLGWQIEGIHHHGDDDAWNIAGLLCMLLRRMRD